MENPQESGPVSTGFIEKQGLMKARSTVPSETIAPFGYLTPQDEFGDVERGNPLPYTLPPEQRLQVGLERESWQLEVVADPESNSRLEQPLSREAGTAFSFNDLLALAERCGVQYLKGITCNNIGEPLGMGLWEGVPLREVIWLTRPVENVRRVFYYGYHNEALEQDQQFVSSLPIGRVLEDPPGESPVLLCYKLNGEFLSGKRGGPVRLVVPEAYGFKSVKWLQRVVLTNDYRANDWYAQGNNDLESPMKSFARFTQVPSPVKAGQPTRISGLAQVGQSGLRKVQFWLQPDDQPLPSDDPYHNQGNWQDAELLPPPDHWGAVANGQLPGLPLHFDPASKRPLEWPMRYTFAYWTAELAALPAGNYTLRCRSIDANGIAQPLPRPFAKSGQVAIQKVPFVVA